MQITTPTDSMGSLLVQALLGLGYPNISKMTSDEGLSFILLKKTDFSKFLSKNFEYLDYSSPLILRSEDSEEEDDLVSIMDHEDSEDDIGLSSQRQTETSQSFQGFHPPHQSQQNDKISRADCMRKLQTGTTFIKLFVPKSS